MLHAMRQTTSLPLRMIGLCFLLVLPILPGLDATSFAEEVPPAKARPAEVVVVGGGLAGLITAYELQNRGITAHILEAENRWGGRVATAEYGNDLRAEYGLHELWEQDPIYEYAKKFRMALAKSGEGFSSVVMDGKLYPFIQDNYKEFAATVLSPEDMKEYTRWQQTLKELFDEADAGKITPKLAPLQDISFGKWMASFKLPPRVVEFIRLGVEPELATDWDSVSALYGITDSGMFAGGSEPSYHILNGNHALVDAFVQAIHGPKTLGARVTRIVRTRAADGSIECTVYYFKNNTVGSVKAKKVVVAVPYHLLHAIQFEPTLTDDQWKAVDTMIPGFYTSVHFIIDAEANKFLLVNGKNPFPILTRGPLGVIYGVVEVPPASQKQEVFSLLPFGDVTRTYLQPQDKLRESYLAELDKLWPGFSKYVHGAYFYGYHPAAIPGWPVGRSPLDALSASLREENVGLYLAGDYLYSSGADGAVKSGRAAAEKVATDLKNGK